MVNILRSNRKIFKREQVRFCIKVTTARIVGFLVVFANISKCKLENHKIAKLLSNYIVKLIKINV